MLQGLLLGYRQSILSDLRIHARRIHPFRKQLENPVHQLPVLPIGRSPAAPHL